MTIPRKDVAWSIQGINYVVRNVPYENYYDEGMIDLNTAVRLEMIRDLMVMNKIEHDVDYRIIEDFEIDFNKL